MTLGTVRHRDPRYLLKGNTIGHVYPSGPDAFVSLDQIGMKIQLILFHRCTDHLIKIKMTNIYCHQTGVTRRTIAMVRNIKRTDPTNPDTGGCHPSKGMVIPIGMTISIHKNIGQRFNPRYLLSNHCLVGQRV